MSAGSEDHDKEIEKDGIIEVATEKGVVERSEVEEPLDDAMKTALFDPKNRLFVLRLEQTILTFLRTVQVQSMELDPMNSFYRLIAHKVAEYYHIGHQSNLEGSVTIYKLSEMRRQDKRLASIIMNGDVVASDIVAEAGTTDSSGSGTPKGRETPRIITKRTAGKILTKKELIDGMEKLSIRANDDDSENNKNNKDSIKRDDIPKQQESLTSSTDNNNINKNYNYDHDKTNNTNDSINSTTSTTSTTGTTGTTATTGTSSAARSAESSSVSTPKGVGSFESREAAYAEARARIFKNFSEEDADDQPNINEQGESRPTNDKADPEYSRGSYLRPASSSAAYGYGYPSLQHAPNPYFDYATMAPNGTYYYYPPVQSQPYAYPPQMPLSVDSGLNTYNPQYRQAHVMGSPDFMNQPTFRPGGKYQPKSSSNGNPKSPSSSNQAKQ